MRIYDCSIYELAVVIESFLSSDSIFHRNPENWLRTRTEQKVHDPTNSVKILLLTANSDSDSRPNVDHLD